MLRHFTQNLYTAEFPEDNLDMLSFLTYAVSVSFTPPHSWTFLRWWSPWTWKKHLIGLSGPIYLLYWENLDLGPKLLSWIQLLYASPKPSVTTNKLCSKSSSLSLHADNLSLMYRRLVALHLRPAFHLPLTL